MSQFEGSALRPRPPYQIEKDNAREIINEIIKRYESKYPFYFDQIKNKIDDHIKNIQFKTFSGHRPFNIEDILIWPEIGCVFRPIYEDIDGITYIDILDWYKLDEFQRAEIYLSTFFDLNFYIHNRFHLRALLYDFFTGYDYDSLKEKLRKIFLIGGKLFSYQGINFKIDKNVQYHSDNIISKAQTTYNQTVKINEKNIAVLEHTDVHFDHKGRILKFTPAEDFLYKGPQGTSYKILKSSEVILHPNGKIKMARLDSRYKVKNTYINVRPYEFNDFDPAHLKTASFNTSGELESLLIEEGLFTIKTRNVLYKYPIKKKTKVIFHPTGAPKNLLSKKNFIYESLYGDLKLYGELEFYPNGHLKSATTAKRAYQKIFLTSAKYLLRIDSFISFHENKAVDCLRLGKNQYFPDIHNRRIFFFSDHKVCLNTSGRVYKYSRTDI